VGLGSLTPSRRTLAVLTTALAAVALASAAPGAPPGRHVAAATGIVWVDPSGGRCLRKAARAAWVDADACGTLAAAYVRARPHDTVLVRPGRYGSDYLPALDKPVTITASGRSRPAFAVAIIAASHVTIRRLKFEQRGDTTSAMDDACLSPAPQGRGLSGRLFPNGIVTSCGRDVTMDGVEIDGLRDPGTPGHCGREGIKYGGDGFRFLNGSIHGVYDRKGADLDSARITIAGTVFYDIRLKNACDPDVHNECIYIAHAEGAVFRNNRFLECPTMALFFSGNPDTDSDGVTVEGNVFTHTLDDAGQWHAGSCGLTIGGGPSRINGWVVRYNTFETSPCVEDLPAGAVTGQWYGNLGGASCIRGFVYHHNVGETCGGASSVVVKPAVESRTEPNAVRFYVDAPRNDFRLRPGSAAIGRGDPRRFPRTDAAGRRRPQGGAPDAGAFEYVAR
jgi:hypothetical protein